MNILLKPILLNFLLSIMAWQDIKYFHIDLVLVLLFSSVNFFLGSYMHSYGFVVFAVLYAISRIKHNIAIADIILISICINSMPESYISWFLIILGTSASLFGLVNNYLLRNIEKRIPLVPFIFISYLSISILLYFS